jgi:hypothetical protein
LAGALELVVPPAEAQARARANFVSAQ